MCAADSKLSLVRDFEHVLEVPLLLREIELVGSEASHICISVFKSMLNYSLVHFDVIAKIFLHVGVETF